MDIVTIGGGTGSPVVNEALLRTGKVGFINAIVTPFDNGGSTYIRRLNSQGEIAYSDAIRILLSLIPPDHQNDPQVKVIKNWFLHRDIKNSVLGQEIVNRRFDKIHGFANIESDFRSLGITLNGRVIPSTIQSSHIVFTTKTKARYKGEELLDQNRFSEDEIKLIELEPSVKAYPKATHAVKNAKVIFLSCGSFYGSVLCNFLPIGMKEALKKSKARIFLITNLFSTRNETNGSTPLSLAKLVQKYANVKIDGLIVPQISRKQFEKKHPKISNLYGTRESSYFLGWDESEIEAAQKRGIQIIKHNAIKIIDIPEERKIVRK